MAQPSDALVIFGVTGDLAYKQIFSSLLGLVRDEGLDVPIVGVANAGWNLDQLKARAKDSLAQHGPVDAKAQDKLLSLLRYVDGDYADPATFEKLHSELGKATRPLNYLAVPPSMFGVVAEGIAKSSTAKDARLVIEKPFGHDRATVQETERGVAAELSRRKHLPHRPFPGQGAGAKPALYALRQSDVRADLEPALCPQHPDYDGRGFRRGRPGRFYDETGANRDVLQNHLLQILAHV